MSDHRRAHPTRHTRPGAGAPQTSSQRRTHTLHTRRAGIHVFDACFRPPRAARLLAAPSPRCAPCTRAPHPATPGRHAPRRDERRTYTFYHLPYSIRPPSQRQATARTRRSSHAERVAGITLGCTQTPSTTRMQQPSANEHLRHTQNRTVARGRSPAAERELAQLSSRTPPARGPSPGVQWMPRQAGVRTCSPAKRGRPAP